MYTPKFSAWKPLEVNIFFCPCKHTHLHVARDGFTDSDVETVICDWESHLGYIAMKSKQIAFVKGKDNL